MLRTAYGRNTVDLCGEQFSVLFSHVLSSAILCYTLPKEERILLYRMDLTNMTPAEDGVIEFVRLVTGG